MQIIKFIYKLIISIFNKRILKNNLISSLKLLLIIIVINTCVPGDSPKGGPKDKKPPKLLERKCNPKNGKTSFKGKKLVFVFDKEIKLNNPYDEIKIIPSLKKGKSEHGYTYTLSRNIKLTLYLDNELDEKTLYVINFGKAISSFNEGVTNENISVTFSTGSKIDSLVIKGQVTDIKTGEIIPNIYVSLYRSDREKTVLNDAPNYFTKTDKQGNFEIKYIKAQKYLIIASNEINFKGKDDKNLGIKVLGFIDKPIKIKKNIKNIKIHAVVRNLDELKINSKESKKGKFEIKFNKPIKRFKIKLIDKPKIFKNIPKVSSILSEDKKTVYVYNWFYEYYNIQQMLEEDRKVKAIINAEDELGNKVKEKLELHFGEDNIQKEEFKVELESTNNDYIDNNSKIKIKTNKPIKELDTYKIYFINEKGKRINIYNEDIKFNKYGNEILIKKVFPDDIGEIVNLTLKKGIIKSIDNDLSPEINHIYKLKNKKNIGSIKGKVYLGISNFIIQLLDNKYKVIDQLKNTSEYQFENIPEGEYTIRILGLSKGRKEWFAGDIKKLEAPDPVYLYHPQNGFVKIIPGLKRTLKTFVSKIK